MGDDIQTRFEEGMQTAGRENIRPCHGDESLNGKRHPGCQGDWCYGL